MRLTTSPTRLAAAERRTISAEEPFVSTTACRTTEVDSTAWRLISPMASSSRSEAVATALTSAAA
jgi:hypothetical protein